MCGFVVCIGKCNKTEISNATVKIKYRGPDDTNYFFDDKNQIYVGHNRLAIMDPEFGRQPIVSEDKKIIIAYNGEIYNQFELRKELSEKNINLKSSSSDTELVMKGYQHWGKSIFEKLDGQFAIAIIDLRINKIYLARDKFGEKPLFYSIEKGRIIIGSELKVFSEFNNKELTINLNALKKYFIYSFIPSPNTIYKDIFKVKHSEYIDIDLNNSNVSKHNYYKPKIIKKNNFKESEFLEELDYLLTDSVKSRLLSDSKIGVFLSGGLDSSIISYYAGIENKNLESYSISVKEESFDEIDQAKKMSEFFEMKLNHTKLDEDIFKKNFSKIIGLLDEPIGAPTFITMFFLSKLTSRNVKSVLSGDGADEFFGGYENFNYLSIFRIINYLKMNKAISSLKPLINFLPISKNNLSLDFKLRRFLQGMSVNELYQNTLFLSPLSIEDFEDLFNEKLDFSDIFDDLKLFEEDHKDASYIDKNYLYFVNFYIPDLICSRADKAGMLNSLEIRSPYLNPKILELMLSIPNDKSNLLKGKRILKLLALKKFKYDFFKIKKGGFTYPMQKWLDVSKIDCINNMELEKFNTMKFQHKNKQREYRNFFHCCEVIKNFI